MRLSRCLFAVALVCALALSASASASARTPPAKLYVSLGDSYATGYQPNPRGGPGTSTRDGFAYQLPALVRPRGYRFKLVNFGCGGATTTSILETVGCRPRARALGGPVYTRKTQTAAAEAFLRANRGEVGLITVSIGGNDVTRCAREPDATGCVIAAVDLIKRNVSALARRLRAAAGRNVRIIGLTYPDVILGQWVTGRKEDQDFARLSLIAFRQLINPALKTSYESVRRGSFIDVTTASGAYGSLDQTTNLAPYGVLPLPVAKVCQLTWYCQFRDIHARRSGYRLIAQLIARALPRVRR
jgi:lysophospholipase L1-like esterase